MLRVRRDGEAFVVIVEYFVIAKPSWFEPRALRVSEAIVDTARSPALRKICLSSGSMLRVRRDGEAFVVILACFVIAEPSWCLVIVVFFVIAKPSWLKSESDVVRRRRILRGHPQDLEFLECELVERAP